MAVTLKAIAHDPLVCGIDYRDSCPACRDEMLKYRRGEKTYPNLGNYTIPPFPQWRGSGEAEMEIWDREVDEWERQMATLSRDGHWLRWYLESHGEKFK